jgi:sodium/potassium-transporting ATPase subunit alpha
VSHLAAKETSSIEMDEINLTENPNCKRVVDITEHLMSLEDVCRMYHVSIDHTIPASSHGLSQAFADKLLLEHGPNVLSPPKIRHPIMIYLNYLLSLFNMLLIIAGILVYVLYGIDPESNGANVSCTFHL